MLSLKEEVFLLRLHQAPLIEIVGQGAVAGAGGTLLGNVI